MLITAASILAAGLVGYGALRLAAQVLCDRAASTWQAGYDYAIENGAVITHDGEPCTCPTEIADFDDEDWEVPYFVRGSHSDAI